MTRDEIIRMARDAGFRAGHIELYSSDPMPFVTPCSATNCLPELVRFAALVAAAEREACAKAIENSIGQIPDTSDWANGYIQAAKDIAEGIRARGNQ